MGREAPLIFLIAGEPSGDLIASRLMAALKRRTENRVRFAGVGGPLMADEGLESLFPYGELSLMGVLEIVPHVPRMLRRIRATARTARRLRPAAFVSIDVPEFALRVARRLKGAGFPLIHYVAPTVWAYRPGRAAKIARYLDHVLCLFPFEPPYFEAEGLDASFVGHPLIEEPIADADGPGFRRRHGIAPTQPVIAVLPGSRASELRRHEHAFGETVRTLGRLIEGLRVLVPTLPQNRATVAAQTAAWGAPVTVIEGKAEKYAAFAASDVALTASGMATLELALAGVPMVVCYRANPVTAAIAWRIVKVPHVAMPNIIAERRAAPEFLQQGCTPQRLVPALEELMQNPDRRRDQIESFAEIAVRLGRGGPPPSERAAEVVLRLIGAGAGPGHRRAAD
ncbi:MAG: lipid-A-disaccharide synthase [Rhodospirillales bacterium]|nr:lipid-A-disaccharide synthase [Rhodospirillales bacterium]